MHRADVTGFVRAVIETSEKVGGVKRSICLPVLVTRLCMFDTGLCH